MNTIRCDKCGELIQVDDSTFNDYLNDSGSNFVCSKCAEILLNEYKEQYNELCANDVRSHNVGNSDYSKHKIQPWDIWIEYKLNPFDADIVKRVLRHKKGDTRKMDYEKIIHICQERIRQIESGEDPYNDL